MKKQITSLLIGAVLAIFSFTSINPSKAVHAADAKQCGANSIIACGVYSEAELKAKFNTGDAAKVYAYFGITPSQITGLQMGRVYKDGRVVVGNKVVATNAQSAGHENHPGSTKIPGVNAYVGPTQNRFTISNSLEAFVKIDAGGNFKWAIILACGNPVKATLPPKPPKPPVTHPKIAIVKDVSKAEVNVGEQFTYTLKVTNTGDVNLTNAHVVDNAPANIEFIPNSSTSGTNVNKTQFLAVIPLLAKGASKTYTFKAKFTKYVASDVTNQACVIAVPATGACDTAKNHPKKPPVVVPPTVTPPVTPETPEVPEIPKTGAGDIVAGTMGLSSSAYGVVSFIRSRRNLKALFRK